MAYDTARRFNGIDLLAENSMEMTPYHFGNNNPNYWADPSGLNVEHLNSGIPWLDAMWENSPAGAVNGTTWINDGDSFRRVHYVLAGKNEGSGNVMTTTYIELDGFTFSMPGAIPLREVVVTNNYVNNSGRHDWGPIGNALGFAGTAYTGLENAVANKYWWLDSRGNYNSTKILNPQANGKFINGVQGYRNGYKSALKAASGYRVAGNIVGGIGLVVTAVQWQQGQITGTEATIDGVMGVVGFMGPIGAAVSATYFLGKFGYEYFSGETMFDKPE